MKLRITTAHTLHKQSNIAFLEIKQEITFSGFHGWQRITSHITAHTTGPDFFLTRNSMHKNPA
jgi:hypothetical protein